MTITLTVRPRGTEANDALRTSGFIPAVFYGPKEKAVAVEINTREFERVFREAGETTLVQLTGIGEQKDTLIHDVQVDPVTGTILHADFYVIEKGKKVEVSVPLHFEGEAPAEKLGGVLVKSLHEIEIEVAPAELPHSLTVDLSKLVDMESRILASDIILPKSATLVSDADEIVASITEAVEEKEEAPAPAAEAAAAPAPEAAAQ